MELEFTPVSNISTIADRDARQIIVKPKGIDEAFEEFLGFEVADGAASFDTVANYKSQVKLFLQWCIDTKINPLLADKRHIQQYRKYLVDKPYKIATIDLKLPVVRRFYDALVEHKLVTFNPAAKVQAPVRRRTNINSKYLERSQFKKLMQLTAGDSPKQKRDRVIIGLMALQGLRTIEVQQLVFGDIGKIGDRQLITVASKRSERTVKLREDVWHWLLDHLAGKKLTSKLPIVTSLSGNNYGKKMSRDGIRRTVNGYLDILNLRTKDFRLSTNYPFSSGHLSCR